MIGAAIRPPGGAIDRDHDGFDALTIVDVADRFGGDRIGPRRFVGDFGGACHMIGDDLAVFGCEPLEQREALTADDFKRILREPDAAMAAVGNVESWRAMVEAALEAEG